MKENVRKIAGICKLIFGYGIMIVLFAGGLMLVGYIAALIIGGETATAICLFISKKYSVVLIYASTILILFGLLSMYLAGEKALASEKRNKQVKIEQDEASN